MHKLLCGTRLRLDREGRHLELGLGQALEALFRTSELTEAEREDDEPFAADTEAMGGQVDGDGSAGTRLSVKKRLPSVELDVRQRTSRAPLAIGDLSHRTNRVCNINSGSDC